MTMTRLTLSADSDVVAKARKQAKMDGTSISAMFVNFIKAREVQRASKTRPELGPLTKEATGMLKVPPDFNYKEALTDALIEKYGAKK
ncbi:MAG: DUF6364 family protein [Victivallaceae bacterium]|jgi:hypothetical protein